MRIDDPLPVVVFDRIQFEQILQNLIGNAIKHLGRPTGEVAVSCLDTPSHWEFQVTDTGVGIDEKHYERIFQVFQTLKSRDELETTGIGLAIVRRIVERHGGTICIESTPGEGTRFHLRFQSHCRKISRLRTTRTKPDSRHSLRESSVSFARAKGDYQLRYRPLECQTDTLTSC